MRLLVTGGRAFSDAVCLHWALDRLTADVPRRSEVEVVEGGCPTGADAIARGWARAHGCKLTTVRADWSLGKRAGPLRNQRMLDDHRPDLALACSGGRGTRDMVRRLLDARVPTLALMREGKLVVYDPRPVQMELV